jgi:hypothetical protein
MWTCDLPITKHSTTTFGDIYLLYNSTRRFSKISFILSVQVRLGFFSGLLPSGFPAKMLVRISPTRAIPEIEENHEIPQSGHPVFGPRFKPGTFRIWSRSVNHDVCNTCWTNGSFCNALCSLEGWNIRESTAMPRTRTQFLLRASELFILQSRSSSYLRPIKQSIWRQYATLFFIIIIIIISAGAKRYRTNVWSITAPSCRVLREHNTDHTCFCSKERVSFSGYVKAVPLHAMQAARGRGDRSCSSLTSALDGGEWSVSRPSRALYPRNDPGTHWIGTVQSAL